MPRVIMAILLVYSGPTSTLCGKYGWGLSGDVSSRKQVTIVSRKRISTPNPLAGVTARTTAITLLRGNKWLASFCMRRRLCYQQLCPRNTRQNPLSARLPCAPQTRQCRHTSSFFPRRAFTLAFSVHLLGRPNS